MRTVYVEVDLAGPDAVLVRDDADILVAVGERNALEDEHCVGHVLVGGELVRALCALRLGAVLVEHRGVGCCGEGSGGDRGNGRDRR